MDHNAGPRAACVTILTMLVVLLLSAIAIVFRLDNRTAGAQRAALACLLFVYLAYLLFEVKVLQLLLSLFQFQSPAAGNWFYPQPPLSFVGTFSPLGSSVGRARGPSPEEASGGRAASPPPPSEAGGMTSEYTAAEPSPAPPYVSGGSYHRRQRLPTGVHRPSSRRSFGSTWAWPSSGGSSSSEVTEQLTSEEEVEPWMGGSISSSAWGSPSSAGGRRRPRNGGGAMAYTNLKHASSKR